MCVCVGGGGGFSEWLWGLIKPWLFPGLLIAACQVPNCRQNGELAHQKLFGWTCKWNTKLQAKIFLDCQNKFWWHSNLFSYFMPNTRGLLPKFTEIIITLTYLTSNNNNLWYFNIKNGTQVKYLNVQYLFMYVVFQLLLLTLNKTKFYLLKLWVAITVYNIHRLMRVQRYSTLNANASSSTKL